MKTIDINITGEYAILTSTIKFKKSDITDEMLVQIPNGLTPDDVIWRMISHQEMKAHSSFDQTIKLQTDDINEALEAFENAVIEMPKASINGDIITCYKAKLVMKCYDESTENDIVVAIKSAATTINPFFDYGTSDESKVTPNEE